MSDLTELERRLTAAIERIGRAVEGIEATPPGADPDELDALRTRAEAAEAQAAKAETELPGLRESLASVQTAAEQLREKVAQLEAMKDRQQARISELESAEEALRAQRGADREELDGLIAALEPLVKEQPNA